MNLMGFYITNYIQKELAIQGTYRDVENTHYQLSQKVILLEENLIFSFSSVFVNFVADTSNFRSVARRPAARPVEKQGKISTS